VWCTVIRKNPNFTYQHLAVLNVHELTYFSAYHAYYVISKLDAQSVTTHMMRRGLPSHAVILKQHVETT